MEAEKLNNELEEITENQEIEVIPEENGEIDAKKENASQTFPIEDTEERSSLKSDLTTLFHRISISLEAAEVKENKGKKPQNPPKPMPYNNSVRSLNLKFYAEQLMFWYMTDDELKDYSEKLFQNHNYHSSQKNYGKATFAQSEDSTFDFLFDRFKEVVKNFDDEFQVIGIIHNKDLKVDPKDYFKVSSIKAHCHLVIRRKDEEHFRINTVMDSLGVFFRRYIDSELWCYSVATCKNWNSSVAYLTHETDKAMAEGKYIYDREEIFSNCDTPLIDRFREGYNSRAKKTRVSPEDLEYWDRRFYDRGYKLEDFNSLYNSVIWGIRSHSKIKTIKESYFRGIEERLEIDPPDVKRVCLFIQGPPNTGKTHSVTLAAKKLGLKTYSVSGGGTGKFDKLSITDQAIIIDDTVCPNLLNMCDDRITQAYRRNSNNPYWTGEVFIVTSNKNLLDWCTDSGLPVYEFDGKNPNEHAEAMKTRFLEFEVNKIGGINQIQFTGNLKDLRGTPKDKQQKLEMAEKIISLANKTMAEYVPSEDVELHFDYEVCDKETGKMILNSELQKKLKEYAEEKKRKDPNSIYIKTVTFEQIMEEIRQNTEKYPYRNDEDDNKVTTSDFPTDADYYENL